MTEPSAPSARSVLATPPAHFEDRDALYGDLDALSAMLDDTLRRQMSEEFLALVESVRSSAGRDMELSFREFENLDLETASQLVRAFSMYFHLANVTEQTHRARDFGGQVLKMVVERSPKSEVGKQAKRKLKSAGLA